MIPAWSIARTENVCDWIERLLNVNGLVQAVKPDPSRSHWKPTTVVSGDAKVKVAVVWVVEAGGPEVMFVVGGAFVVKLHEVALWSGVPSAAWTPVEAVAVYAVELESSADGVSTAVFVDELYVTPAATGDPVDVWSVNVLPLTVAGSSARENVAVMVVLASTPDAFAAGDVEETVNGDGAPLGTTDASTK